MADTTASTLRLDATRVRRLLLVQAIEEADKQGRLLGAAEREPIERAALQAVADPEARQAPEAARYLDERARRILATVALRDPRTAGLQRGEPWLRLLAWLLPLLALLLGAGLERIDNPQQVNMLSPPLLAFLAWNLLVYLAVLLRPFWPRLRAGGGALPAWGEWLAHPGPARGGRRLRADIAARLRLRWFQVAGAVEGWRLQQVFHASAAAWAIGVGLSIVAGGLVREYRVGWESTLLDLPQVHAVLSTLFAPVVALLPLEGFTMEDLARMHFRSGAAVGQAEARHWIALYLGLLGLLVVLPRSLLALHAALRKRWAARALPLDLREPYFAAVMARVSPARVVLGWTAGDAATRELMLRLWREASASPGGRVPTRGQPWTVLQTERGDELLALELAPATPARPVDAADGAPGTALALGGWRSRLQAWWRPPGAPADPVVAPPTPCDLLLVAVPDPSQAAVLQPVLAGQGAPVLLLAGGPPGAGEMLRSIAAERLPGAQVLELEAVAGAWFREDALREAILARLPGHQQAGAARLLQAWRERHEARLEEALRLLAGPLVAAAREAQALQGGPVSLRGLVDPSRREAAQHAQQEAMGAVLSRLAQARERSMDEMARLYGLPAGSGNLALQQVDQTFTVHRAVDLPQAGMAGAASGAAAGATVDLVTGGLTLGAAAALGAVLGGGAAFVAAAWKNRAAPGGTSLVQLSDEMLQALCELALLQYLAVTRREGTAAAGWRSEVVALVESRRDALRSVWAQARQSADPQAAQAALCRLLGEMVREGIAHENAREAAGSAKAEAATAPGAAG